MKQKTTYKNEEIKTVVKSFISAKKDFLDCLEKLDERRPITFLRAVRAENRLIRLGGLLDHINPFLRTLNDKSVECGAFFPRDETGLLLQFSEENKRFKGE